MIIIDDPHVPQFSKEEMDRLMGLLDMEADRVSLFQTPYRDETFAEYLRKSVELNNSL